MTLLLIRSGPDFLKWIKHISWFFYGYEALAIVQWKDVNGITCRVNASCPPGGMTGDMVLAGLGFKNDDVSHPSMSILKLQVQFHSFSGSTGIRHHNAGRSAWRFSVYCFPCTLI